MSQSGFCEAGRTKPIPTEGLFIDAMRDHIDVVHETGCVLGLQHLTQAELEVLGMTDRQVHHKVGDSSLYQP